MSGLLLVLAATGAVLLAAPAGATIERAAVPASGAAVPRLYNNCTNFNKRYPHSVGRRLARDKTKSGDPVTNFRRSTTLYRTAMRYNDDLDRDNDGIACEKK
jgi:hypothetical protein